MKKKIVIAAKSTSPNNTRIETMKKYFDETHVEIGTKAPETSVYVEADVNELMETHLPQYQRDFEVKRCEDIVKSIINHGPIKAYPILIVRKGEGKPYIHDGRHRTVAFWILGFKKIPAIQVEFNSEEDEIAHFNTINSGSMGMKRDQKMLNEFQANDPYAMLIYDLGATDPDSKWSDKVALLGTDQLKEKMSVSNFCKIVNWAGFGIRRRLDNDSRVAVIRKLKTLSYKKARENMNLFHDWFFNFATPIKVKNDTFHNDRVLISLLEFFYCTIRQTSKSKHLQPRNVLRKSISSFRTFNFLELTSYDAKSAPDRLFTHFNTAANGKPKKNQVKRISI
jgi:hypothetical protein